MIKKILIPILVIFLAVLWITSVKADGSISVYVTGKDPSATISATVSGVDEDIDNVSFYVDDNLKGQDKSSPYSISWNTSGTDKEKEHAIKAKAFSASGEMLAMGTATVSFNDEGGITGAESPAAEDFGEIEDDPELKGGVDIPAGGSTKPEDTIAELLARVINWILGFAGIIAVIAVVYSGYMYITSFGDEEKAQKAKKNLTWAIIGTVVIVLAFVIVRFASQLITTQPS